MIDKENPDEVKKAADTLLMQTVLPVTLVSDPIGLFTNLGYQPRKYGHDIYDLASSIHQANLNPIHRGITHPYIHAEDPLLRRSIHFPDEFFLQRDGGFDYGIDLEDAIMITRGEAKRLTQYLFEGNSISCFALPLLNLWVGDHSGAFIDLQELFPDDQQKTHITFCMSGWWHDNLDNDVLISVPLRASTKDYQAQDEWDTSTGEFDGRMLRYFYLHEKVHQYLAQAPGITRELNSDENCNRVISQIIQHINQLFPKNNFFDPAELKKFVSWQKRTSDSYST